ncbi:MAG: DUF503 domain-containing protein [Clostridia bacterium]|nr:DUF503 domain-containing protein [Clostridia bacterium]
MQIAVMEITLHLGWVHSLKEKRSELKSLLAGIRNKFNVSAAESDMQDVHQMAAITVAMVASDRAAGDAMMEKVICYMEQNTEAVITDVIKEYR